ncbi:unnamed protein product [Tilletia laevis]|uniref:Uncharacterized protein n=1 Tax=Tilletia laevis TaxID=157183 RepID=A0A9N8QNK1_9BASI|nr:unnamed protein product [Tilletia laevis]CAD6964745.1 unnamed protein product [Tilletia laevis]
MSGTVCGYKGKVLYTTPLPPSPAQFALSTPLRLSVSGKAVFPVYSITYRTTKDSKRYVYALSVGSSIEVRDARQAQHVPAIVDWLYFSVNTVGTTDAFVVIQETSRLFHVAKYHGHIFAQTPAVTRSTSFLHDKAERFEERMSFSSSKKRRY